jgi:hypothetical protein
MQSHLIQMEKTYMKRLNVLSGDPQQCMNAIAVFHPPNPAGLPLHGLPLGVLVGMHSAEAQISPLHSAKG